MPISRYIPGKVDVNGDKFFSRFDYKKNKLFFPAFFLLFRRRSTFDSLCSGARTSTWPRPTKTWPTPRMCISTALGNSTTLCEF